MPTALVPLAQGCEDLEAVTIIDVLRRGGLDLCSASLDSQSVRGARGTVFVADVPLDSVLDRAFDLVALPGGQPGAENLRRDPRILELLKRHHGRGAFIAAVCAAPAVLAEAGLLRGRRVTCFPGALDDGKHGAELEDAPVVRDGRLITGRSAGAALDFSLALVEALMGPARRGEVEKGMLRP
ncbi:MAG TPA: DJ-1 family glyoxalase III [bacterium]|jgi:4-methyl-5(b-hydroxyethyl)-thiazole monophosphate biosynthesis|nr:DJ-1 family glyoxalase III [bacterium]